ncbi:MAG: phosphoribosylformylglycinamidine synthase subunit PurL, partial [Nakamurella sp.]
TDQLRFGPIDAPDTARVLPGVVAGISAYGNCLGLANIGGETYFDASYAGNPLVNAGCIGVLRAEDMHTAHASGAGNKVILYGSRTGLDGIGGASVLASATFTDDGAAGARRKLPSVQVGDPFAEKVLIECTLEIFAAELVVGISDLGAAGLACATSELAAAGDGGMDVNLDVVPLRAEGMTAAEILSSESQERMCAVVTPDKVDAFLAVCEKWEVSAVVLGEVTDTGRLVITHGGEIVVDVPPRTVAIDGPVYHRPIERPASQDALVADTTASLPRPTNDDIPALIVRLAASENLCHKGLITDQYDRYVRGNTVLAQPADAGMIRVDDESTRGLAMASDCNARVAALDPYRGAQFALAEAYRNIATSGATPVAVTNCLNFGSPEDPAVMWQFREAVHGLADGCAELGIPVTGGNVSFYNQTGTEAILPTPVVGVLGVIDDVATRIGPEFGKGPLPEMLFLLGDTKDELDGSEWARLEHGHLGGIPPQVDLAAEQRLGALMAAAAKSGLVSAAHDLSEGGLSQALVEMCVLSNCGAAVTLPPPDPFTALFSESTARILVAVPIPHLATFAALCEEHGVPSSGLGTVTAKRSILEISGVGEISLADLREAWMGTLPSYFN